MNAYFDYLVNLIEPDGSFVKKSPGGSVTGFPDEDLAAKLALLVELRAVVTELSAIREALEEQPTT